MPGHIAKTDGPDPDPDPWLVVSDELRKNLTLSLMTPRSPAGFQTKPPMDTTRALLKALTETKCKLSF